MRNSTINKRINTNSFTDDISEYFDIAGAWLNDIPDPRAHIFVPNNECI